MLRSRIKNSIRSYPLKPSGGAFSFGNALQFDGVNDYVSHSNITMSGDFTISCWVKLDVIGKAVWNNSTNANNYWFPASSTVLRLQTSTGISAPNRLDFTVPTMSTSTWYHVCFTRIGTNVRVYLNGTESSTGALVSGNSFTFNQIGNYPGFIYDGTADEFGIITNKGLSAAEVSSLYNGGDGDFLTNYGSPEIYFRFNESGTDTTAVDSSGNGNDGTLTNFSSPPPFWVTH